MLGRFVVLFLLSEAARKMQKTSSASDSKTKTNVAVDTHENVEFQDELVCFI